MIAFEFLLCIAIVSFLIGYGLIEYCGRPNILSCCIVAFSVATIGWGVVGLIAHLDNPITNYYDVQEKQLPEVGKSRVIIVTDEDGKKSLVNLETVGLKVPDDGRSYRVARMRYRSLVFGIRFNETSKYKVVPKEW